MCGNLRGIKWAEAAANITLDGLELGDTRLSDRLAQGSGFRVQGSGFRVQG